MLILALDSHQFENCFVEWGNSISEISKEQAIAIDDKTLCREKSKGTKSPVYGKCLANEYDLVLGETKV